MTDLKRLANRDLIQRLTQAGADDPLWSEFIARFRTGIRVTVLRTLRTEAERTPGVDANESPELIEDLTQEVFVRLLEWNRRALSRFQGRSDDAMTDLKRLANRDLIQRLTQAGADDPLWSEFIARFRTGIRVTVLRTLRTEAERTPGVDANESPELIEDLTQEVFVRLLEWNRRALSRFQGRSELSAHTT